MDISARQSLSMLLLGNADFLPDLDLVWESEDLDILGEIPLSVH